MKGNAPRDNAGFSLAETLVALLILSLSVLLLSSYQQQLVNGYRRQWAQREAARVASQRLAGKTVEGWQSEVRQENTADGCRLIMVQVRGPFDRRAALEQLFCPPFNGSLPE